MQNKSHLALKARLSKCHSLEEVIKLSRKVTNPFLNPNHEDKSSQQAAAANGSDFIEEPVKPKRPQPQRWAVSCEE
ncbi:hypothetical protein [Thaumasiovibrio subtropicus]|uniref:hypothetical protein n=1 Tax=Thaumasiovibrio subtropicus TaxID=1891207 RepID=UPI00131E3649|nr:hypothetical protein [Thaumasiovibrio subtropicus]